jgi:hypothetical protein
MAATQFLILDQVHFPAAVITGPMTDDPHGFIVKRNIQLVAKALGAGLDDRDALAFIGLVVVGEFDGQGYTIGTPCLSGRLKSPGRARLSFW